MKSKCTCVDVKRFKDMFANSKRFKLAEATTGQPSICLLFLSFLFSYAESSKTKIINQQMYGHGLIHLHPSDKHFFYWYLVKSKIRKSTAEQDCSLQYYDPFSLTDFTCRIVLVSVLFEPTQISNYFTYTAKQLHSI